MRRHGGGRNCQAEVEQPAHVQVVAAQSRPRCLPLHPQTRTPKDDHPHEDIDNWGGHCAGDELLDSPTDRDLSNEHANKGAPGDPPAPVEDSPAVHPVGRTIGALHTGRKNLATGGCSVAGTELLKGVAVEAKLEDVLEIVAHRLDVEVEKEDSIVHEEDNEHEGEAAAEAEL